MKKRQKKAVRKGNKFLYWFPRIFILVFAILIFIFSLLSGAEQQGGGLLGVIKNSPNALPWLILLVVVYFAWKYEKFGGYFFLVAGILTIFAFDTWEDIIVFLIVSFPLLLAGILFLVSYYFYGECKNKEKRKRK